MRRPCRLAAIIAVCVLLGGCFTGQRPTLQTAPPGGNEGAPVGDANADAVLTLLEAPGNDAFTATYTIVHKFGGETANAVVASDGNGKKSVTINDVRFLLVGSPRTCSLTAKQCESGVVEQRVSNLGVSSTFADNSPARRLRVSVRRKTDDTRGAHRQIAGQDATCVTVPVGGGSEVYCAIVGGHLAFEEASDVHIELVTLTATSDPADFSAPA